MTLEIQLPVIDLQHLIGYMYKQPINKYFFSSKKVQKSCRVINKSNDENIIAYYF